MEKLKDWYYEGNDFKESDDFKSQNFAIKGSTVEIFLFYISLIALTVFSIIISIQLLPRKVRDYFFNR